MPTNAIKHRMLVDAKRIANKEYHDRVERVKNLGTLNYSDMIVPAISIMNDEINQIIKLNPEYDETLFRKMIKEIQQENKTKRFAAMYGENNDR